MNNPVDMRKEIFQDLEEPEPQHQQRSTAKVSNSSPTAESQTKAGIGEKEVGAAQAVPYQFQTSVQFSYEEDKDIVDERGYVKPQFVRPTENIYSAATKLLESYGSDLGSTARTYTAVIEVAKPQPQASTDRPSKSQSSEEGQNNPPTPRVISAYNEALSTYENNPDRRAATDLMYSGVLKVEVANTIDVIDNAELPELRSSLFKPTFYAIQDGKDYLVLPIPGQPSIKASTFRSMYDVVGEGSSIESIREAARFRADENGKLSLVQKGSLLSEGVKEADLSSKSTESLSESSVSTSDSATTKAGIRSVEILRDYDKNTFSLSVTEPGETSRNVLLIDTKSGFVVNKDIRPQDFQYLDELATQHQSVQSQERGNQVEI